MVADKYCSVLKRPSRIVALVAATLSLVLGVVVLVGWYSHNTLLIQVSPAFVPMQYNTALGFFLSGISVVAFVFKKRRATMTSGGFVGLVGLLTLIEYVSGMNLGIDELFMDHYIMVKTSHPGRMAPNTALCFLLTGVALITIGRSPSAPRNIQVGGVLGAFVLSLGTVAFVGYVAQLETAYGWGHLTRMAVHTAGGFMDLGIGVMALAWAKRSGERLSLPDWLPVAAAIVVATVSVALWQAMLPGAHQEESADAPAHVHHLFMVFGVFLAAAFGLSLRLMQTARDRTRSLVSANIFLRESEEKFRSMSDAVHDAVIMMDHEGRVSFWNTAAERIFGYSAPEIVGKPLHETLAPERYHEGFHKNFPKYQKTGQGTVIGQTLELVALRRDGTEFPVEISLNSVQRGESWWAVGVIRDISGRKQAEQKILQAQKLSALGHLVGGICHELNNMLLPILSLTGMTVKGLPVESRERTRLEKVLTAAKNASAIVQQLQVFSRWNELNSRRLGVRDLVEEISGLIRTSLPSTIDLRKSFDDIPDQIDVDPEQIQTALINVTDNAKDSLEGGVGVVELTLDAVELDNRQAEPLNLKPGRYVHLSIRDNGCGMDNEMVEKIFDPFFTTKEVGEGTGLGLPATHGIVTQHGGAITVVSRRGEGSVFDIYLPSAVDR